MGSIIEIVLAIFIVVIIGMTFFSEPKLSVQYYKAAGKSVGVVVGKSIDVVNGWIGEDDGKDKQALQEMRQS